MGVIAVEQDVRFWRLQNFAERVLDPLEHLSMQESQVEPNHRYASPVVV